MNLTDFPDVTDAQKAALLALRDGDETNADAVAELVAVGLAEPQGALTESGLALVAVLAEQAG
jgi:hypothetical protein